jgi:hypothetical protein
MNGIIFAGDSFTWGQGLYFYSELPRLFYPPFNEYIGDSVTKSHRLFKNTKSFARLVSNYFNTFEIKKEINGGSDEESLEFIDDLFKNDFTYNDFDFVILQTTQPFRTKFDFVYDDVEYNLNLNPWIKEFHEHQDIFLKWLDSNNYTYEDFKKIHIKQIINKIKNKFIELESNGIKCLLFCWKEDYIDGIKNDIFLNDRFIQIDYQNEVFDCLDHLSSKYNQFTIINDPYFEEPPLDFHTSLEAQTLIANSIIKKIKTLL